MSKVIVTITGPSCAGKTTLAHRLIDTGMFTEIISTTTRTKRIGEVSGSTYHFVDPNDFKEEDMLEHVTYNGNTYGASIAEFEKQFASGRVPLVIVEPNGMKQVNINAEKTGWVVVNVFVNCDHRLQAERFINRFTSEYEKTDERGREALLYEYVNRMVTIQEAESRWFDMFLVDSEFNPNKLIIPYFMEQTEKHYVQLIGALVDSLL